ncbi:MAG: hypothetical protein KAJ47_01135 [Candidatus Aenigmarchaeota archaeon]|nr:hypothetical protein [Candidatus Aenigmarchaeota archaeon]
MSDTNYIEEKQKELDLKIKKYDENAKEIKSLISEFKAQTQDKVKKIRRLKEREIKAENLYEKISHDTEGGITKDEFKKASEYINEDITEKIKTLSKEYEEASAYAKKTLIPQIGKKIKKQEAYKKTIDEMKKELK